MSKSLRVLVVTNMYPPHHYGGYELSCRDTVRAFRAAGHRVDVLTSDVEVPGAGPLEAGTKRDLRLYWRDHELLEPTLLDRFRIERSNQRALGEAVAAGPDVVSVWNAGALSLGLLTTLERRGLKVVYVIGDDWPVWAQQVDAWSRMFAGRRPVRRLTGRVVEAVTGIPCLPRDHSLAGPSLFNSESMRRSCRERSGWAFPRSAVVHPGVDTGDFPPAAQSDPVVERPWAGRLLYVGRLDERKGVDTAIRALPALGGMTLRIVGRGDAGYRAHLVRLAEALGVGRRVELSEADRPAIANLYRSADALVFPSVHEEPFGIVPLEAMACDLPVVASATGGSAEYLEDGINCLTFQAGDPASLAAAVERLSAEPGLRSQLVRAGRSTARHLTADAYAAELLRWHEQVAGEPTSRGAGP